MAQSITDYASFFAGAKKAVREQAELAKHTEELEEQEKKQERVLQARQRAVADAISETAKQRTKEISESYDAETEKARDRLRKVRVKREKAKNQGIRERIEEDTASLVRENREMEEQLKTLLRAGHVPAYCRSRFYYAMYFTKGIREAGVFLLTVLICFLAVPCGIFFLIPDGKPVLLALICLAVVLVFGGLYVAVGNRTKMRHGDVLKEGREIRNRIRANEKKIRIIARTIRKDKNEAGYNLEKFDDEIAQLEQDISQIASKKKEALNTFETVTRSIISDEIMANNKAELEKMGQDLENVVRELKETRDRMKENALEITDRYEVYLGKEFMTEERLASLEQIIRNRKAANLSEAIAVYRKNGGAGQEAGGYIQAETAGNQGESGKKA